MSRHALLLTVGGLILASTMAPRAPATSALSAAPSVRQVASVTAADPVLFRFVSIPDFLNADIGDTRDRAGLGWDPGDPNSINDSWRRAIDVVLDAVEAEHPRFVLVAGDLVNGRWDKDDLNTGIFGPSDTDQEQLDVVQAAGDLYYGFVAELFALRGLPLHPALGDHDLGDNPWPLGSIRLHQFAAHKAVWAEHFTLTADGLPRYVRRPGGPGTHTAYAFRVYNSLFVTLDEFYATPSGVERTVDPEQLTWLAKLFARARSDGVRHIVVQGHLPIIGRGYPAIPSYGSSRLFVQDGAGSALWQLFRKYHVALYLAGEMHAISERVNGGVVQIVHGCATALGQENYLVGEVHRDRIVVRIKRFAGWVGSTFLWQMTGSPPAETLGYARATTLVATYVIRTQTG